jgi:hypothetical protein
VKSNNRSGAVLKAKVRKAMNASPIAVHWATCKCEGCVLWLALEKVIGLPRGVRP